MLGASPLRAIVDVVVPLMKSGILAGMLLAFIVSFNEFTVTYFLYTIDVMTVPIWMYSRTVSSLDPTVFLVCRADRADRLRPDLGVGEAGR